MSLQGSLAIERMCFLAGLSKAGFYRYLRAHDPWDEEMGVRSEIQRITLEHQGRYGYRRMTAELRRQGLLVNHKRVARIMRDEVYINLGNRMKLTGTNQLWVADITLVRLKRGFVFLAVVLDRFSRKVVGWNLDRTMTARLTLAALEKALKERRPQPGLVHHSDRGTQYMHAEYLRTLRKHGMIPSVGRPASPGDNASCESFFRTLKREEVDAKEFRDLEELRLNIAAFIDRYYNQERLHSALGYRPPAEFERVTESSDAASISTASKIDVATGAAQSSVELQFVSQLSRSRLSQRGVRLVDQE